MSIYLSNDSGFDASLPGPTVWVAATLNDTTVDIARVITGDFNGDGKTDIARINGWGTSAAMSIFLSNGNGFATSISGPAISVAGTIDMALIDISRVKIGDFNGDGKTDIARINGWGTTDPLSIFRSNGAGFELATAGPTLSVSNTSAGARTDIARVTIVDLDGDGKSDIPISLPGNLSFNFSRRGDFFTNSGGVTDNTDFTRYRLYGDFNGNGTLAPLYISGTDTKAYIGGYQPSYTLKSLKNGIGGQLDITYKSSANYDNLQLPFPVQTVSSTTWNDGLTNPATTEYSYSKGFYHIGERDFRGFNYAKKTDPTGANEEQKVTETWSHQGNDTDVITEVISKSDLASLSGVATGYMKGKVYRERISDQRTGKTYSEITTSYLADDNGAPFFTPRHEVNRYTCDGAVTGSCNASNGRQIKTVYAAYDSYGNLLEEDQYGDVGNTTDDRTIARSYSYNLDKWIVGLPSNASVYAGIGKVEAKKASSVDYYYDSVAYGVTGCSQSSTAQTPSEGNVTREVYWNKDGVSPETHYGYDLYGNKVCVRDARTFTYTTAYDASNTFPTVTTNPLGHQQRTAYYGVDNEPTDRGLYGQVKKVTDANQAAASHEYDTLGRETMLESPGFYKQTYYMNIGNVNYQNIATLLSEMPWSQSYFDGLGREYRRDERGPDNDQHYVVETDTIYDPTGRVMQSSFPYFQTERNGSKAKVNLYDTIGRVVKSFNNLEENQSTVKTCYSGGAKVTIDADKHRKRESYDGFDRLVKVEEYTGTYDSCSTDALAPYATTLYEYDAMNNLTSVLDSKNNKTVMKYDTLGRKYSIEDPDAGIRAFVYDGNGNAIYLFDTNGETIGMSYDELNRLTYKVDSHANATSFVYDEAFSSNYKGRLTSMYDASGSSKYYYDARGRTTKIQKTVDATTYQLQAQYDGLNRLSSLTYPDGEVLTYSYNGAGSISQVGSYATYTGYDAVKQKGTVTFGNNVATSYGYYPSNNRLYSIATTSPTDGALLSQTYSYSNVGNVTGVTDYMPGGTRSQTFVYDALNRLTNASGSYGARSYDYDQIGNITSKDGVTLAYTPSTGPHSVSSTSSGRVYQYDANGNVLSDGVRTIAYNSDNLPKSITGAGTVSFVYDGFGNRVKKTSYSGTQVYIDKFYECFSGTCSKYIFAGEDRIALKISSETLYYHPDHLGSTNAVTTSAAPAGHKVEEISYYPYGKTRSDTGTFYLRNKFTSQEFDFETGLYNYRARLYDPETGRFITPDTIVPDPGNPQSLNRYSYVLNNPINHIDPTGHMEMDFYIGGGGSGGGFQNEFDSWYLSTRQDSLGPIQTGPTGNHSSSSGGGQSPPSQTTTAQTATISSTAQASFFGSQAGTSLTFSNYTFNEPSSVDTMAQQQLVAGSGFGSLSRGDIVSAVVSGVDIYRTFAKASSLVTSKDLWLATAGVIADTMGGSISLTPMKDAGIKNWIGGTVSVVGITASALALNPSGVARGGIGLLSSVPVFYSDKSESVLDWWIDRVSPF